VLAAMEFLYNECGATGMCSDVFSSSNYTFTTSNNYTGTYYSFKDAPLEGFHPEWALTGVGAGIRMAIGAAEGAAYSFAAANLGRSAVGAEVTEFAMLGRFASGMRTSWDKSFVRHEATEYLLSWTGAAQTTLHRWALGIGGITAGPLSQYYLYHPAIVQRYPEFFNSVTRAAAGAR
jgi:hypothetical protein